ncbi:hypothetical protein F5880DRAFT_1512314 [Lentinula raphanica]|nr:hypothetical protein F5880DRAFT_1512314 [Lentinula raphanica]
MSPSADVSMAQPSCPNATLSSLSKRDSDADKEAREAFAAEYYGQLQSQTWIQYNEGFHCDGYDTNQEIFMKTDLTTAIKDRIELEVSGNHNEGVFFVHDYKYTRETKIVKLVNISPATADNPYWARSAACEVNALKAFGRWVDAGFVDLPDKQDSVGVIVMDYVKGVTISNTVTWRMGQPARVKKEYLDDISEKLLDLIYEFVIRLRKVFVDIGPSNVLITEVDGTVTVTFVDLGHPGVWPTVEIIHLPTKEDFAKYHWKRWYLLWEYIYMKAGIEIPAKYQWRNQKIVGSRPEDNPRNDAAGTSSNSKKAQSSKDVERKGEKTRAKTGLCGIIARDMIPMVEFFWKFISEHDLTNKIANRKRFKNKVNGKHNLGIFTLTENDNVVVKLIKIDHFSACKVAAMKRFQRWVKSGYTHIPGEQEPVGVIMMERVKGDTVWESRESKLWDKKVDYNTKLRHINHLGSQIEEETYRNLVDYGALHGDTTSGNVIFDKYGKARLLDLSEPSVWQVNRVPSESEFHEYQQMCWYFLWEDVYNAAGIEIPAEYQWRNQRTAESKPEDNSRNAGSSKKAKSEGTRSSNRGTGFWRKLLPGNNRRN